MKALTSLPLVFLLVSVIQIQKLNAQSGIENNTLIENSAIIATNVTNELVYSNSLQLLNNENITTNLSGAQPMLIDRNSEPVSQVSTETAALPETTLRDLKEVLAIDCEENQLVESWMLSPDKWIVSE